MDNGELEALRQCLSLCERLHRKLETDADSMAYCVHGQLLDVYRAAIAEAVKRVQHAEVRLNAVLRDVKALTQ